MAAAGLSVNRISFRRASYSTFIDKGKAKKSINLKTSSIHRKAGGLLPRVS